MPSLALTDYSNMYGSIEFYRACQDKGVKPILGVEFSVPYNDRVFKLVLLAKNLLGYKNLMRLTSVANLDNPENPILPFEKLKEFKEGLIILSGGPWGELSNLLVIDESLAEKRYQEYLSLFGENFYLELSPHTYMDHGNEMRTKTISFAKKIMRNL